MESAHKVYQRPYERTSNDRNDTIFSSSTIQQYATARDGYSGRFRSLPDALTEFGLLGGFQKILDVLALASKGEYHLKIQHLCSMCNFLSKTLPLWTRPFAIDYTPKLTRLLITAFQYINKDVTDQNKGQMILGVLQDDDFVATVLEYIINLLLDPIWKRHYTMEMIQGRIQCEYRLLIGSTLMRLPNLQKRI